MTTETETNLETGVAAEAVAAPTDDLSTEAFDRMEAPDDEDEAAEPGEPGEGGEETSEAKPPPTAEDPDLEEIELSDGRKVKVPKELALERLRHQDYTRKTQEAADARRALETERSTWETEREASRAALPAEHARLAIIDRDLQQVTASLNQPLDAQGLTLKSIDWPGFRQLARNSPDAVMADGVTTVAEAYRSWRGAYDAAHENLADLQRERDEATNDLKTKEDARLSTQREAATADLAKRREDTGKALAASIEGWNGERAAKVITYANDRYGVTPTEMGEATDPRIWRVLHDSVSKDEKIAKLEAALKQHQTANGNLTAQEAQPAAKAKGSGASVRDPATPRGDQLATKEWMRRRNEQEAAKKRA